MDSGNISGYDREAERLASKLQQLLVNVEAYRLNPESLEQLTPNQVSHDQTVDNLWVAVAEDDILDVDEDWLGGKDCWAFDKSEVEGKTGSGVLELDGCDVEAIDVIHAFKESAVRQLTCSISTRTFARPKKGRSSLCNIGISTPPPQVGSPKLRRRLTTTIDPSPALIPHLEQLSRTNNRPLSNCDDLNWEDGAEEGEALADQVYASPKRPTVPASLLQRLQELKATNNVRSPFSHRVPTNPMSVSQILRDIPDYENAEADSLLSLGESIITWGEGEIPQHLVDGLDTRLTFGGVVLPPGRTLLDVNKTFAMPDPLIEVSENNLTFSKDDEEESKLYITNYEDENRNTELKNGALLKGYSSKLFDGTFSNAHGHDATFEKEGVELMFDAEKGMTETVNSSFMRETVKIEEKKTIEYSTATFSRPVNRFSPSRSGLPMRRSSPARHVSTEDLARSPTRSDGTITPVDLRPAHGTYTRNSPIERNGSEDEQMSTTSDHSGRSHDSIEDLPNRCKTNGTKKRQISTPRSSAAGFGLDDWHMSPISQNQMTPARSMERLAAARVLNKLPHGPMPLKPALIRPTENFKRPIIKKKNDISSTQAQMPIKPPTATLSGLSGLPKPAGTTGLPTRIPANRLSSIPRPPSARLGTTFHKSNS